MSEIAMKCANCKHWGRENEDDVDPSEGLYGTKRCGKALQMWDAGKWDAAGRTYVQRPDLASQMMFVKDGSDYRADLYTKAEFFCAHFEPERTTE